MAGAGHLAGLRGTGVGHYETPAPRSLQRQSSQPKVGFLIAHRHLLRRLALLCFHLNWTYSTVLFFLYRFFFPYFIINIFLAVKKQAYTNTLQLWHFQSVKTFSRHNLDLNSYVEINLKTFTHSVIFEL